MSYPVTQTVAATTDANGAATVYTPVVRGRLMKIAYVKTDFADGVGFTITGETTLDALLTTTNTNASAVWYPATAAALNTNGAAQSTLAGPVLGGERIKIVVASGGNAKTGTFHIVTG